MKREIILFVIGVLVGAVIATGAFYVYTTTLNINTGGEMPQMQNGGGQPPEMPNGQQPPGMSDGQNGNGGQPPQMPGNGANNQQANNSQTNA